MSPTSASEEHLSTVRLGHLNMIQGVISRISGFSANAKNFCITILAAIIGISFQYRLPLGLLLPAATFIVVVFGALDTYYLAQERRFRDLYNDVAARPLANALQLELNPGKLVLRKYFGALRSFSTGGYYTLLLIAAALLLIVAYGRSDEARVGNVGSVVGATEQRRVGDAASIAAGGGADAGAIEPDAAGDNAAQLARATDAAGVGEPVRNASAPGGGQPVRPPAAAERAQPVCDGAAHADPLD